MRRNQLRTQRRLWAVPQYGLEPRPDLAWLVRPRARWRWGVRALGFRPVTIEAFLYAYYSELPYAGYLTTRPSPLLARLRRDALIGVRPGLDDSAEPLECAFEPPLGALAPASTPSKE